MCASPFRFLTDGPPPPRVVLLPDSLFFSRSVPVATEATEPRPRAEEIGNQAELAFETLAPFPLAQLYYGHFWTEGADRALVFAAYRRRFTGEQTEEWRTAELVLPTFAAILAAPVAPATTVVIHYPEGLTAVHWAEGKVPVRAAYRPLPADVTEEGRAAGRDALLREFESREVIDLTTPPAAAASDGDGDFVFTVGTLASRYTPLEAAALDVRDKEDLAARRRARRRDIVLWRTAVGCVIAFGVLLLGELALIGGGVWQSARRVRLAAQAGPVEQIQNQQEIATRIENLRTRRLLTVEMIEALAQRKPQQMYLTNITTSSSNMYTLVAQGTTSNPGEISLLQDALQNAPEVSAVNLKQTRTSNQGSNFTITVTFKPAALKPFAG